MKAYQKPVSEIILLQLKDTVLDKQGEPRGSFDVERLDIDPDAEEIGGDEANVFSKSLWEE